ncbi:MAG: hybrid sensor histidine kinase/response regulator [Deltaproteobacteria bacterium]|nr:hybrid sensor histidine kinase/response regulator [Deltaproteobacteria bacterium]
MSRAVLAVDDEPASLRAVQRALADSCRVLSASSGSAAWEVLATQPVALMVVDQRMPDMLGTQLLARTAATYPDVVRLLLTGYAEVDTLIDAINAGHVYHYLTKPWEPAELRLAVGRGLERYEATLERHRLLGELTNACQRLEREAEQKGRLLTLAAHELGTPLHVLMNSLDLLSAGGIAPAAWPWLQTARRNAAWLGRGLAQMMTAGGWRQRPLPLRGKDTDLRCLLASVCARFAQASVDGGRRLRFDVRIAAAPAAIWIDPLWIERAVANLLSNAVRFTPDDGAIRVRTAVTPEHVEVAVSDSGIGIDAAHLDQVFEPFSAATGDVLLHTSGELAFGARGLGLGLAIARSVADQHGGTLTVTSQLGAGSCFTLRLPLRA